VLTTQKPGYLPSRIQVQGMWRVEHVLRDVKSLLGTTPMYHLMHMSLVMRFAALSHWRCEKNLIKVYTKKFACLIGAIFIKASIE
jgi:hypothetical protein